MTTALETDDHLADDDLDELTRLALAADPDAPLDHDAVPVWQVLDGPGYGLLPSWYMPTPMGGGRRRRWSRRKRIVVVLVIVAFLAIDAAGLCSTYGNITIA